MRSPWTVKSPEPCCASSVYRPGYSRRKAQRMQRTPFCADQEKAQRRRRPPSCAVRKGAQRGRRALMIHQGNKSRRPPSCAIQKVPLRYEPSNPLNRLPGHPRPLRKFRTQLPGIHHPYPRRIPQPHSAQKMHSHCLPLDESQVPCAKNQQPDPRGVGSHACEPIYRSAYVAEKAQSVSQRGAGPRPAEIKLPKSSLGEHPSAPVPLFPAPKLSRFAKHAG